MALLVYKFSDYEHTAEREQYRVLCKYLKAYYENRDEICIFIANYNIYDCELDGMIIKQDAIMAVELKNFGGTITAVENGHWKAEDGTIVKGGSRKSVYQQANLNHLAIKRGFEEGDILPKKTMKNVAALVVFHQPITLVNQLSQKTQSWLHVCDETTFMEKVQDITSSCFDLSKEDMIELVRKMALDEDYLEEDYSNREILHEGKSIDASTSNQIDADGKILKKYFDCISKELFAGNDCVLNVYRREFVEQLFAEHDVLLTKDYIVTITSNELEQVENRLRSLCNFSVNRLGDLLFFEAESSDISGLKMTLNGLRSSHLEVVNVKQTLPYWLDHFIYDDLNGVYCKSNKDMVVIDWGKDDVLKYLGTYFPRSYTEAYCIVSQYLDVANPFSEKTEVSLFDFGCGTGGEIIGTITAIIEKNLNLQHINILALDGNYFALRTFEKILVKYCTKSSIHITYKVIPLEIDDFYDLSFLDSVIDQKFDMVISFKAICEFVTKQRFEQNNAYTHMAKFFLPRINSGGILLLADVTTYNNVSQEWLPHMMDEGLAKANCKVVAKNNGYNQAFFVTHSRKKEDISKIAWRLILN